MRKTLNYYTDIFSYIFILIYTIYNLFCHDNSKDNLDIFLLLFFIISTYK